MIIIACGADDRALLPERIEKVWIRLHASLLRDPTFESLAPPAPKVAPIPSSRRPKGPHRRRRPPICREGFRPSERGPLPFLERPAMPVFGRSLQSALTRSSRVAASIIGPIIDCACPSLPDDRLPWIRYRFLSGYGPNYGLVCRSNRGDIFGI